MRACVSSASRCSIVGPRPTSGKIRAGKSSNAPSVAFRSSNAYASAARRGPPSSTSSSSSSSSRGSTSAAAAGPDGIMSTLRNILGGGGGGSPQGGQEAATATATRLPSASALFADAAPSWPELEARVADASRELGWSPPDLENGARANAMSMRRMFGTTGEPRVKLYRDHAAWCPYCQKVWLQLEEKKIPYVVQKENMRCYGPKTREYLGLTPSGLLPALELDGRFLTESSAIAELLERAFPDNRTLVPDAAEHPAAAARHAALLQLERRLFGDWLDWLVRGGGGGADFFSTLGVVEGALAAPASESRDGRGNFKPTEGPYFLGEDVSLCDLVFAPFLERIAASIPYYKGVRIRGDRAKFPALNRWFDAMETRDSYLGTKSDVYTHVHDLPPQLGGCAAVSSPERRAAAAAIDGSDGSSWHLPLAGKPLTASSPSSLSFEEWPGEDPPRDRLAAAARLVSNRAAVARFAARGAPGAKRGNPAVSAPLADPFAVSDEEALGAVDAALRAVADALLRGHDGSERGPRVVEEGGAAGAGAATFSALSAATAAGYLRDRVGVPRDLPLPAARQLRAHLNWFIDSVSR